MKETGKKVREKVERQYFRIDDSLPFEYHHMSKQEYLLEKGKQRAPHLSHGEPPEVIDDPLLQYLQAIDRKLNFIIRRLSKDEGMGHMPDGTSEPDIPTAHNINVSAGGLRFSSDQPYKIGSILRVRVGLPPTPYSMFNFIGKVVRVEPSTGDNCGGHESKHNIAIQFIDIGEAEREEVLRYVFEAERVQIKEKVKP